jgi:hypothetical protein
VSSKIWWKKSAAGAEKSGDTHALSRSNFEGANNGAAKSAADFLLSLPFHKAVAILERRMLENSLRDTAGNKTEAPNRLQMNRRLFDNKMIEHKTQQTKVAVSRAWTKSARTVSGFTTCTCSQRIRRAVAFAFQGWASCYNPPRRRKGSGDPRGLQSH